MTGLLRRILHLLPLSIQSRIRNAYHNGCRLYRKLRMRVRIGWGKATRLVARPAFPRHPEDRRCVHLGCGEINHPAFINVDAIPYPHVHYVGDISRLTMFADNSVDFMYASHCLEHVSYHETALVLAEWYRVLKPGGVLRLSVPDFDQLVEIYRASAGQLNLIIGLLYGGHDSPFNVHMAIFNRASLEQLMTSTGFVHCRKWRPHEDELSALDDFSSFERKVGDVSIPVSLNLEATKPSAF